ncbi:MAG TPA: tetratricopeptide repeat protein, partial [Candidatus Melainabacteria bacterium]|nr:tetratricopeptide repeat protein [Candidatus Melainabacteria bacterium]
PLWNAKGVIYNEQKLLDSAMKSYEKAVLLDPRYFTAWSNLGSLYARRGQFAQSEQIFDYLTRLAPDDARVWTMAARLKMERAKGRAAERYLLKALELNGKSPEIWFRLAYDYHGMKQYDKALTAYKKSLSLKPDYAPALKYLGVLYQD